jgi:hypothetical protein
MTDQPQQPQKNPKGYGKRPLWQWVLLYIVIGVVIYGLIYYFFFMPKGGGSGYTY